tara:strand:+ start:126 stop:1082 length:957 start_codon:yes stop_codon:yes gene_type:complete
MSWYFAAATFAAGTYGAVGKRKGARAMARERKRAARETLITAKYNIHERNKESKQTQFQVLESGGSLQKQIAIEGLKAGGAATVSAGTSGAVVGTGSTRAALSNIAREALVAQTDAMLDTKNRIKSIARDTENQNRSEWRNAKLHQQQQNRVANREKEAAEKEFYADMVETGVKSYTAGASIGGANVTKWGGAKTVSPAGGWSPGVGRTKSGVLKSSGSTPGSGPKPWEVKDGRGVSKMKGYSMDKVQPTGGRESSNTWERLAAQSKRGFEFSSEAFGRVMNFSKGRVNTPFWNFILGRGLKGKAAKTTFPSMKTGRQ